MEFDILYKTYLRFVLGESRISPQEAVVCGVSKGQFHGVWFLDSSDDHLCIVHTVVGDSHCSKTGHSAGSLQFHRPNSAAYQLVH